MLKIFYIGIVSFNVIGSMFLLIINYKSRKQLKRDIDSMNSILKSEKEIYDKLNKIHPNKY